MDKYKQKIPPYKMHQPEILFDLSEYKKEGTPPELFMSLVGQIKENTIITNTFTQTVLRWRKKWLQLLSQTQKSL